MADGGGADGGFENEGSPGHPVEDISSVASGEAPNPQPPQAALEAPGDQASDGSAQGEEKTATTQPSAEDTLHELEKMEELVNPFEARREHVQSQVTVLSDEDVETSAFIKKFDKGRELEQSVDAIFTTYADILQQELSTADAPQKREKALKIVQHLTKNKELKPEQLEEFMDADGNVLPDKFKLFLENNTQFQNIVDEMIKIHDVMKQPHKEQEAVQGQMDGLVNNSLATPEEVSQLEKYRSELSAFNTSLEKIAEKADVPGAINMLFAIEGGGGRYGNSSLFHNGLEKKTEDMREQASLTALAFVFDKPEMRTQFLLNVFEESLNNKDSLTYEEARVETKKLFDISEDATDDQKKIHSEHVKEMIFNGLEAVGRTGGFTGITQPESLNLTAPVIKTFIEGVEKMNK